MRRSRKFCTMLAGFLLAISSLALAQTDMPNQQQIAVEFTTPVIVGDKILDPGHYIFEEIRSQQNPTVFKIYRDDVSHPVFQTIVSQTTVDTRENPVGGPARTRFVLLSVGDNYYLSKLWLGGQMQGWDFLQSTKMANKAGKEITVEANQNNSNAPNSMAKPQ